MRDRLTHTGTFAVVAIAAALGPACSTSSVATTGNADAGGGANASAGAAGAQGDSGTAGAGGASAASCDSTPGCTYSVDSEGYSASTTLECFCTNNAGTRGCPATLTDALDTALGKLPCLGDTDGYAFVSRGCGVVTVGFDGLWGVLWHYDETTGAMLGAEAWDDLPGSPCGVFDYSAGTKPTCASAQKCTPCTDLVSTDVPLCN